MKAGADLPVIAIVGRKNSGKTTLVVALAAELKRRGLSVATIKHGHPHFEIDRPGSDSWRHVHEGGADAVVIASSAKVALIERREGEPDPEALIARLLAGRGYDVVLVEGYKRGPFPKIEIFRRAAHDRPIHDPREPEASGLIAVVTDDASLAGRCPVIELDGTIARRSADRDERAGPSGPASVPAHVPRVADLIETRLRKVTT